MWCSFVWLVWRSQCAVDFERWLVFACLVFRRMLDTVRACAAEKRLNRAPVAEKGGIDAVLAAIQKHEGDAAVVEFGIRALCAMMNRWGGQSAVLCLSQTSCSRSELVSLCRVEQSGSRSKGRYRCGDTSDAAARGRRGCGGAWLPRSSDHRLQIWWAVAVCCWPRDF